MSGNIRFLPEICRPFTPPALFGGCHKSALSTLGGCQECTLPRVPEPQGRPKVFGKSPILVPQTGSKIFGEKTQTKQTTCGLVENVEWGKVRNKRERVGGSSEIVELLQKKLVENIEYNGNILQRFWRVRKFSHHSFLEKKHCKN